MTATRPHFRSQTTRAALLGAALLLLGASCGEQSRAGGDNPLSNEIRRREAAKVRVTPVVSREMMRILSTTTNVESEAQIDVFPRVAGVISEVLVEEGDVVEAGQILAVVDPRDAKVALDEAQMALREAREAQPRLGLAVDEALERAERARLALEQAQREVARNEKAGLLSEVEIDRLRLTRDTNEHDWEAAKIAHKRAQQDVVQQATTIEKADLVVERQQLNLSHTEITATFAGVIAERAVKVGDTVSSGAKIFTLTDPDHLRAVVHRPQRELSFFQGARAPGDESTAGGVDIRVFPEAFPGVEYRGEIKFLSPNIDVSSGSFRVTIALEQPAPGLGRPRLAPGMLIRLEIVTERHPDALVVPKRALRREGDRHFLFAVRGDSATRIAVEEGFSSDELVEVLPIPAGALVVGEPVVVVGNRDLEDGSLVEAETWATDEAAQPESGDVSVAGAQDEQDAGDDDESSSAAADGSD